MNTFKNWSKSSYWIYFVGALIIASISLSVNKLTLLNSISLAGALAGFLSVVLIVNKNRSAGYVGMLSAVIYMFISWHLGNYSDTLLNVLFIMFLNIPLIRNKNYSEESKPNSIKDNPEYEVYLIAIFIGIFIALYAIEVLHFKAPRPFFSVLAASLGITASIATSFFVLKESFFIWGTQNIFQVLLWGITLYQTGSGVALLMMVTYIMYTINASTAFFNGKWFDK